jgi:hypothetical protein
MDGRDGLKSLMLDVQSGTADFQAIFYDVSRWGRFPDAGERVYHEHFGAIRAVKSPRNGAPGEQEPRVFHSDLSHCSPPIFRLPFVCYPYLKGVWKTAARVC